MGRLDHRLRTAARPHAVSRQDWRSRHRDADEGPLSDPVRRGLRQNSEGCLCVFRQGWGLGSRCLVFGVCDARVASIAYTLLVGNTMAQVYDLGLLACD